MSINTQSVFFSTTTIDDTNASIDFNEGAGEITVTLSYGSYAPEELLVELKTQMDAGGTLVYTVSLDRDTRAVTISSTANFDLLISTGTTVDVSAWLELGFSGGADLTGATTHTSTSGMATEYIPQFILQDYVESKNYKEKISPTVNESASGELEVVSFGTRNFFEMSFKFITNLVMDGVYIRNNPTGEDDFRAFMDNAIEKGPIEFMPDRSSRSTYFTLILESTSGNSKGTGYKLMELTGKNMPEIYELNKVKFRVK